MSERYRTRNLLRERAAQIARGERPPSPADEQLEYERRNALSKLQGAPHVVVRCTHGAPWLECTTCSKPRSQR